MSDTLDKIISELRERRGELVLNTDSVVRLIGVTEDEEDYYYVYYDGKRISLVSCVIKYIPLRGKIEDLDYKGMLNIAKWNHADFSDQLSEEEVAIYRSTLIEGISFIAGPYWNPA
jgi:hypothetical protein